MHTNKSRSIGSVSSAILTSSVRDSKGHFILKGCPNPPLLGQQGSPSLLLPLHQLDVHICGSDFNNIFICGRIMSEKCQLSRCASTPARCAASGVVLGLIPSQSFEPQLHPAFGPPTQQVNSLSCRCGKNDICQE